MKKILEVIAVTFLMLFVSSCSSQQPTENSKEKEDVVTESKTQENVQNEVEEEKNIQTLNVDDFEALLLTQNISIIDTNYVVQDENYKSLYPDMLQVILQNNTNSDIKDAVVAYVAWDENNLPVKIEGSMDFTEGSYIKEVRFDDINLVPNGTYGEKNGFELSENNKISQFKAIPVSYVTFDGSSWKNPYYDEFKKMFEGVKYNDELAVEVEIEDEIVNEDTEKTSNTASVVGDYNELENNLKNQDLVVIDTNYVVQDENYKALYPDLLQVILQNNSENDIRDVVVAYVAWDENNLPIKIQGSMDFTDGSYVKEVKVDGINLIPGGTYGESNGFAVSENNTIAQFKVIPVSYVTFGEVTWNNPYYKEFKDMYAGKKLQN